MEMMKNKNVLSDSAATRTNMLTTSSRENIRFVSHGKGKMLVPYVPGWASVETLWRSDIMLVPVAANSHPAVKSALKIK